MNSINIGQIKCIFPTNNNNDIKKKEEVTFIRTALDKSEQLKDNLSASLRND